MEWSQLQSYTERVLKSMDTTSTSYIIIEWMYSEIKKKDKDSVCDFVKQMSEKDMVRFMKYARSNEEKRSIIGIMKKILAKK